MCTPTNPVYPNTWSVPGYNKESNPDIYSIMSLWESPTGYSSQRPLKTLKKSSREEILSNLYILFLNGKLNLVVLQPITRLLSLAIELGRTSIPQVYYPITTTQTLVLIDVLSQIITCICDILPSFSYNRRKWTRCPYSRRSMKSRGGILTWWFSLWYNHQSSRHQWLNCHPLQLR